MSNYHTPPKITLENFPGASDQGQAELKLCTDDPESHMNLYARSYSGNRVCACMSPKDARTLRDQLIEAYPLDESDESTVETMIEMGHNTLYVMSTGPVKFVTPDGMTIKLESGEMEFAV